MGSTPARVTAGGLIAQVNDNVFLAKLAVCSRERAFMKDMPTPSDNGRRAMFGWLTDKEQSKWAPATEADLPEQIRLLVASRTAETDEQQVALLQGPSGDENRPALHARWDLLADTAKGPVVWAAIARTMGPQALQMNLNTLQRHGVFEDAAMVQTVADRLADENEIRRSRQFPYQYFAAYLKRIG